MKGLTKDLRWGNGVSTGVCFLKLQNEIKLSVFRVRLQPLSGLETALITPRAAPHHL